MNQNCCYYGDECGSRSEESICSTPQWAALLRDSSSLCARVSSRSAAVLTGGKKATNWKLALKENTLYEQPVPLQPPNPLPPPTHPPISPSVAPAAVMRLTPYLLPAFSNVYLHSWCRDSSTEQWSWPVLSDQTISGEVSEQKNTDYDPQS